MFKDSVGNTYSSLPRKAENHTAKSTRSNSHGKAGRAYRNGRQKPAGITRKVRQGSRKSETRNLLIFSAGSAATSAVVPLVNVAIVASAKHSFLADVPVSWIKNRK